MAKAARLYVCQSCGATHNKWAGKCEACNEWNSIVEEASEASPPKGLSRGKGKVIEFAKLSGTAAALPRRKSGIEEFDRVTGGGLVPGSAILIGGDPGIGKSTLLLQVTALLSKGANCAYVSGEEAIDQVRMRALRLGHSDAPVALAAATNVRDIIETMDREKFDVIVIDSIQTMYLDNLDSAPGTVAQVRASAQELIRMAKKRGTVVLLVGHVT
ncbi:MAG TPA: ATPase domain-containing protein, partial [Alphaproteobacteria bacterium]|nr:ATPase domain-containing protein [Alphaproteobacteria bacterium]